MGTASIYLSDPVSVGSLVCLAVLAIGAVIARYIGMWCTLQKMGRHDFAALIPYYDAFELSRGAGMGQAATLVMLLSLVASGVLSSLVWSSVGDELAAHAARYAAFARSADPTIAVSMVIDDSARAFAERIAAFDPLAIAYLAVAAVAFVFTVRLYYGISRSFGHGVGYTIGFLLFDPIMFAALGAGRKQVYRGPMLDSQYRAAPTDDWPVLVRERMATFGSNAPLALAILGLSMGAFFLTVPGIALCIAALVKNAHEKDKPLAVGKSRAARITAIVGIVVSLVALAALAGIAFFAVNLSRYGVPYIASAI